MRELVIETEEEIQGISKLEETLKWGEPSFLVKNGSTLRMDCTFRLVFDNKFQFEGSRAIVFQLNQKIPIEELKECIKATLTYHKVKHLMALGI